MNMCNFVFMTLCLSFLIGNALSEGDTCTGWSYHDEATGPSNWASLCSTCDPSTYKAQSPINIDTSNLIWTYSLPHIYFSGNYDNPPDQWKIKNDNGHTVVFVPSGWSGNENNAYITGGPLNATYNFHSFHFHFGCDDTKGAEHTVDSWSASMEIHLVHYNSKYTGLEDARNNRDGLAVIGILVEADNWNSYWHGSYGIPVVSKLISDVTYPNAETSKTSSDGYLTLSMLLPDVTTDYYTYAGSLTTPPCSEAVQWIVMKDTPYISDDTIGKFRNLEASAEGATDVEMCDNFRPIQDSSAINVYSIEY